MMLPIRAIGPSCVCHCRRCISCGCALRDVHSFAERGFDPARYHTYRWAPADDGATGDPRLDDNPFFHRSVQTSCRERAGEAWVREDDGRNGRPGC